MSEALERSAERTLRVAFPVLRGEVVAPTSARRAGVTAQTVRNWKIALLQPGTTEPPGYRAGEIEVRVGDHQMHASGTSISHNSRKSLPEPFGLTGANVAAEDLPLAIDGGDGDRRGRMDEPLSHTSTAAVAERASISPVERSVMGSHRASRTDPPTGGPFRVHQGPSIFWDAAAERPSLRRRRTVPADGRWQDFSLCHTPGP